MSAMFKKPLPLALVALVCSIGLALGYSVTHNAPETTTVRLPLAHIQAAEALASNAQTYYAESKDFGGITVKILADGRQLPAAFMLSGTAENPTLKNAWGGFVFVLDGSMGDNTPPVGTSTAGFARIVHTGVPAADCMGFIQGIESHAAAVSVAAESTPLTPPLLLTTVKALNGSINQVATQKACAGTGTKTVMMMVKHRA